jgi:Leucine-rich repeat (LRR) protein
MFLSVLMKSAALLTPLATLFNLSATLLKLSPITVYCCAGLQTLEVGSFTGLHHLKKLVITRNPMLEDFPPGALFGEDVPNLEQLVLSNNNLHSISVSILGTPLLSRSTLQYSIDRHFLTILY